MCKINLCSYLGTYRLFPCFWFCLTEIWVCIRLSDCRLAFKSKRFDKPWIRKNTKTRKRRNKASNKFLNFRARKPDVGGGDEVEAECVCVSYPRKRARKQSAVLESCAATDVISEGQRKKGRVRGNPPLFFFSSTCQRQFESSAKRKERRVASRAPHGSGGVSSSFSCFSLRFALLAPGTASN